MSSRYSYVHILVQVLLTTICLFVATLLIPQSGYSAAEISGDSTQLPPPPPPRVEHAPPLRVGYIWTPGHWDWNGRAYRWIAGNWVENGRAPWVPDQWQEMDARWQYLIRHWERP